MISSSAELNGAEGIRRDGAGVRAVVYNDHLAALGGGERSTFAYAKALQELGYATEVASFRPVPSAETLVARFGEEFATVPVRTIPREEAQAYLGARDLAVFVNHTLMSFLPNPAPLGVYAQMFPTWALRSPEHDAEIRAIESYQLVLSNSEFTQRYTRQRWGDAPRRLEVLRPPIGSTTVESARKFALDPPRKAKQFVHVGRFNPSLHNKNQLVLIEAFLRAKSQFAVLRDWRLTLLGALGSTDRDVEYHARCLALAEPARESISIRTNVPESMMNAVLAESFAYVHATGAFLPPSIAPERCEHFGLSILEGMSHGCLALVYARGGVWDVAADAPGVHAYLTERELVEGYAHLATLYDAPVSQQLARDNAARASVENFTAFKQRLKALLGSVRS